MALLERKELVYRHIKESKEDLRKDEIEETSPLSSWFYEGKTYILVPMTLKSEDEKWIQETVLSQKSEEGPS